MISETPGLLDGHFKVYMTDSTSHFLNPPSSSYQPCWQQHFFTTWNRLYFDLPIYIFVIEHLTYISQFCDRGATNECIIRYFPIYTLPDGTNMNILLQKAFYAQPGLHQPIFSFLMGRFPTSVALVPADQVWRKQPVPRHSTLYVQSEPPVPPIKTFHISG